MCKTHVIFNLTFYKNLKVYIQNDFFISAEDTEVHFWERNENNGMSKIIFIFYMIGSQKLEASVLKHLKQVKLTDMTFIKTIKLNSRFIDPPSAIIYAIAV